jgi:hypothetical protein
VGRDEVILQFQQMIRQPRITYNPTGFKLLCAREDLALSACSVQRLLEMCS